MNAVKPLVIAATIIAAWVAAPVRAAADAPAKPPAQQKPGGPETKPAATAPTSKTGKVGSIRYTAPKGWEVTQKEKEQIAVLNPPGETPLTCSVILVSGEVPSDGDFLKWFQTKWTKLCKGMQTAQSNDAVAKKGAGGVDVLYQSALLQDDKKNTTGLLLYAAKVGDVIEWAVFQTAGTQRFNKYNKSVSSMLGSLKFERKVEAPAEKKSPDDPLDKPLAPAPKKGKKAN
jgi:hypothetical protein